MSNKILRSYFKEYKSINNKCSSYNFKSHCKIKNNKTYLNQTEITDMAQNDPDLAKALKIRSAELETFLREKNYEAVIQLYDMNNKIVKKIGCDHKLLVNEYNNHSKTLK